jgi:hypothetical protein
MSPFDNRNWRHVLRPSGTIGNTIARRLFIIAGFMVLSGIVLSAIAMLLGLEGAEWAFVLMFWLGIMLSVPALAVMLLTGSKQNGGKPPGR